MSTTELIAIELNRLSSDQQRQVLEYAQSLHDSAELPRGARVEDLLQFAGQISMEDLREMEHVIEEGCEQVNEDAWK